MSKKQKNLAVLASVFLMLLTIAPVSNAMHIMEGFLPVKYCILWGVICVPFLVIGFMNIKKVLGNDRRTLTVLALTGAFVFVLSSLKIPSVTGSCSHMTGTGLGAILFGGLSILGLRLQDMGISVSQYLVDMIPYLATIIIVIISSHKKGKENQPPMDLGNSYFREER